MESLFSPETREPETRPATPWRRFVRKLGTLEANLPGGRLLSRFTFLTLLALSAVFGSLCGLLIVSSIELPQMDDLARYRPNTTTELFDVHGNVFGSFALERRIVVPYSEFPPVLRQAIISIEDKTFERNWGVNLFRALGAAYRDLHASGRAQGASTITMQLARNLFLSSQKTYGRKLQEVFLSMQIERRFTKQQIFELYANQIYLGHGTYGFEAGSEFFFSKHVRDLTLPEAALLAALPKGPEAYSPLKYPERAIRRRNLVLSEMLADGKITAAQEEAARSAPLGLHIEAPANSEAPYFVEEVRRQLEREYGAEEVHGAGLRVYTTLDLDLQRVANKAILDGTAAYERRHGWKGRLPNVLSSTGDLTSYRHPDWTQAVHPGTYIHGLVTDVNKARVEVRIGSQSVALTQPDWQWTNFVAPTGFLHLGDVVYLRIESETPTGILRASLQQDSGAQAAIMAVDNSDGEVLALVGGRDFALSQFNRATQAQRQVGSSFKPYVYTTAIENGARPTDIVVDAPISFPTPSGWYTPHNYEGDYRGAMTLLNAFAESRNIPALKLAHQAGIRKVIETAHRFGITSNIPAFLPVAIGSADITLFEQVGAYSVFPNDGIRIEPHYIRKVSQADGLALPEKTPQVNEVISVDTARTMMQLLQAVTRFGTAASLSQLKHPFGGKTGTTNDYTDAWFIGFSPSVTCGTWIGYDNRESLGEKETGARAALPMWTAFMKAAVAGRPNETFASAGAPKKVLDVAPTTSSDTDLPARPRRRPQEDDEDTESDTAPAERTSPAPVERRSPAPVERTSPAPVERTSPAPVERRSPGGPVSTPEASPQPPAARAPSTAAPQRD